MSQQGPSILPLNAEQSDMTENSLCLPRENQTYIQNITGIFKQQPKSDDDLLRNIQNGHQVSFYFDKLLIIDHTLLLLHTTSLILTIVYVDSDYYTKESQEKTAIICLYVLLGFMILSVILAFLRYTVYVELQISRFELSTQDNIWSSEHVPSFIFDILIIAAQPYPFLNEIFVETMNVRENYSYQFKINYFLALACFFKIFVIARTLLQRTNYMTPRSVRVCKMYEAQNGYLYAVKGLFMDSPMMLIGITFLLSILIFTLAIRICQRDLTQLDILHGIKPMFDLQDMTNVVWFTIITMTTVGFGDIYPRSLTGRIIVVVLIIWGSVIVSLIIVVLTNSLTMVMSERRALTVLNRLDLKSHQKNVAASLIGTHWRQKTLNNKLKEQTSQKSPKHQKQIYKTKQKIQQLSIKAHKHSKNMSQIKQQMQSTLQFDDLYQQLTRQFDSFSSQVDSFIDNQRKVNKQLDDFINGKKNINNKENNPQQQY